MVALLVAHSIEMFRFMPNASASKWKAEVGALVICRYSYSHMDFDSGREAPCF